MRISEARQESYIKECTEYLRKVAPYKTGNLANNAIFYERIRPNVWRIAISGALPDLGVAPYVEYTNENWNKYKPPLRGKQNPNEGWVNKAFAHIVQMIAIDVKGKIKQ